MQYLRPSFFIIGERKCGTSSLYRYLIAHPNVLPCALKEPNFFGKGPTYVEKNIKKYWTLFPPQKATEAIKFDWPELNEQGILYEEEVIVERQKAVEYITGEASVNTFYEVAPELVKRYLPNIKLILLFRNPIERTFSHHRMYQRFQEEGRDLGFEVQDFETDMLKELAQINKGGKGHYLSPSIYLPQLQSWIKVFGKNQIRVYFAEDLREISTAKTIMTDIQNYLDLPFFDFGDTLKKRFNVAPKTQIKEDTQVQLRSFFQKPNQDLADYLGRDLPDSWDYLIA